MATWLERQWAYRGACAVMLLPLSWLFGLIVGMRRLAYHSGIKKSHRLPVPVVVIGNISVGGTGKTPLVLWLVERLRERGYTPGIISRGYGGSATQQHVSVTSDPSLAGDEPVLLAKRAGCPVWVGSDRVAAGESLLEAYPECDIIVSDDGLQHYTLQRDVEIAVVDGQRGFGNGWMLPAGPLREPVSRLGCVDAVVTHGDESTKGGFSMELRGELFCNLLDSTQVVNASHFSDQCVHAVAGIGNPQRFFSKLHEMGLMVDGHAFPDHHPYRLEDLQIPGAEAILMTEKDAVKCVRFAQPNWWVFNVSAEVSSGLLDLVLQKIRERDGRQAA